MNDSLTRMDLDYIKNYVSKEELDKATKQVVELKKDNTINKSFKMFD